MAFLTKSEIINRYHSLHRTIQKNEKITNTDNKILLVLQDSRYNFDSDDIKEASIDLCISNKALRYKKNSVDKIHLKEFINSVDKEGFINNLFEEEEIDAETGLKLMPNETVFTTSRDYIVIPTDLIGFVFARSWAARLGLMITFSAPYLPPGVQWNFPLQIKNCTEYPIILFPLKLIQIMFSKVSGLPQQYEGDFLGSTDAKSSVGIKEKYPLRDFIDKGNNIMENYGGINRKAYNKTAKDSLVNDNLKMEDYRDINRKAYNKLAEEYRNRVELDREKDESLLKPFFDYLKSNFKDPIRALDLGCGNGLNLQMFVDNGFASVGIDISEAMTGVAHEVSPKSLILTEDFLDCRFETECFEGVLSKASIHLFKKQDALFALDKVYSLLVPNGMLFIATTVSDKSEEGLFHKHDYKSKSMRYRKYWKPEELEESVLQVGFKIKTKFTNHEKDWDKNWFNILAVKQN